MPDAADRARAQLVADLVRDGRVRSDPVREALAAVPRQAFLPALAACDAYADEAVAIKTTDGVTVSSVSQPSMVAIMLEQLAARPGHRVLEIGAGAGWNAGLLAHIVGPAGAVTTLDIDDDLVRATRSHLDAAGIAGVDAVTADGSRGHPPGAPYDRIELTVGATDVRPEWVEQLTVGGRLVLPLAVRGSQMSIAFTRTGPGRLESVSVRSCSFVRLRGAGADASVPLRLATPGWAAQVSGCGGPAADLLDRALARPAATTLDCPDAGSVPDVWDGLGLWCALADPAVFRLLATGPAADGPVGRSLMEGRSGRVAVGVAAGDGFALLVGEPERVIRGFGDDAAVAAARLAALVAGWVAADRPQAADLRIRADVLRSPDASPGGGADSGSGGFADDDSERGPDYGRSGADGAPELTAPPTRRPTDPTPPPGLDVEVTTLHARLRIRMP